VASSESSLLAFFRADLRSRGMAEKTTAEYVRQVRPFIALHPDIEAVDRLACSEWIYEPDTQSKRRHRRMALHALFRALVEDGTLTENPVDRIKQPVEAITPQPAVSDEQYAALLASCNVKTPIGKRDRAIIAVLDSTGCRVSELAAMDLGDVDLEAAQIVVRAPKRDRNGLARVRNAYLSPDALKAVASWLRWRNNLTDSNALWVSSTGERLKTNGIQQMVHRRGEKLGFNVTPHQFRRRLATRWLLHGGSETTLKTVGGWQSTAMIGRYTAAARDELAKAEHARLFRAS